MEVKKCAICGKETIYTMSGVSLCYNCLTELEKIRNDGIEEIIRKVCEFTGVSQTTIKKRTRVSRVVVARQLAMYFAKRMNKWSLSVIADKFGHMNHSAVSHSEEVINNYLETDPNFCKKYNKLFAYYK